MSTLPQLYGGLGWQENQEGEGGREKKSLGAYDDLSVYDYEYCLSDNSIFISIVSYLH